MESALINGVKLCYQVTGHGFPLVWCHEFAGDYRSWDPQVKFFSRRYRVITYNARGYPPSDVPEEASAYSKEQSVGDLFGLLRHLEVQRAYVGGLSMGGNVALSFGLAHKGMAAALIVAAAGAAADLQGFNDVGAQLAYRLETEGMEAVARAYAEGPTRLQLLRKDPKGWEEFRCALATHSAAGSAHTFLSVILGRPTIYDQRERLEAMEVPTLVMVGDEDEHCLESCAFLKQHIPSSGLAVFPQSGHAINLEEPDLFNRAVLDFLTSVEAGHWARQRA